jgi:hypothetical protein
MVVVEAMARVEATIGVEVVPNLRNISGLNVLISILCGSLPLIPDYSCIGHMATMGHSTVSISES